MFDYLSSSGASVDQSSNTRRQVVTSGTAKGRSICQILGPAGSIYLLVLAGRSTEQCMPRTRLNGSSPETSYCAHFEVPETDFGGRTMWLSSLMLTF